MSRRDQPEQAPQSQIQVCGSVALFIVQLGNKNDIFCRYEKDKSPVFEIDALAVKKLISWLKQRIQKQDGLGKECGHA